MIYILQTYNENNQIQEKSEQCKVVPCCSIINYKAKNNASKRKKKKTKFLKVS